MGNHRSIESKSKTPIYAGLLSAIAGVIAAVHLFFTYMNIYDLWYWSLVKIIVLILSCIFLTISLLNLSKNKSTLMIISFLLLLLVNSMELYKYGKYYYNYFNIGNAIFSFINILALVVTSLTVLKKIHTKEITIIVLRIALVCAVLDRIYKIIIYYDNHTVWWFVIDSPYVLIYISLLIYFLSFTIEEKNIQGKKSIWRGNKGPCIFLCLVTFGILIASILVPSSASYSKTETTPEYPDMQHMPIETVDYENSKSVGKYLYSLRGLGDSKTNNQSEYPSLEHLQYLYFHEQKGFYNCSVLVDYSHNKFIYDYEKNLVMHYLYVPENIRELNEKDIAGIESLLVTQDIFNWPGDFDGTGGEIYGEYEGFWNFSLLFDDGSAFVTSGQGDYEVGWPDQYYELKDALFALAEN